MTAQIPPEFTPADAAAAIRRILPHAPSLVAKAKRNGYTRDEYAAAFAGLFPGAYGIALGAGMGVLWDEAE